MAPSSLSEHFYERLRDSPELLEELWSETDAYVSWTGPSAQGHLPGLNWNTDFRKAYTLLIWLRPHIVTEESKENNKEELPSESSSAPRILYRFSTSPDDSEATGVCVFCSEWTYRNSAFEATLTAKSYPSQQEMTAPLTLKADEWHLVGFTHVFPFLKHPTLTVTINGQAVAHGELAYPVLEEDYQMMEHNYLMRHILTPAVLGEGEETNEGKNDEGVAEKLKEEASKESPNTTEKEREAKKEDTPEISQVASEEIPGIMQDVSLTSACEPRTPWQLDLAAFALYPVAIGSSIQAVTAQAGPHLALQSQDGRILPTLPPVCNWSKGSSLEGPKVGIPLTVHSVALDLQRLSGRAVFSVSAMHAKVLGQEGKQSRLVWTPHVQPGSTDDTPRVGLVQPSPPIRLDEDSSASFYSLGACQRYNALEQYVAKEELPKEWLTGNSKHLSVCLQEQGLAAWVLPFFLALSPSDLMNPSIHQKSWQYLWNMYRKDGSLAAQYIRCLATYIQFGGGRVHEQVLQSGLLHILATCLRLGLLRASKHNVFTAEKIPAAVMEEGLPSQSTGKQTPPYLPPLIVGACAQLVSVCCGPAAVRMADLVPHDQIRKTSDLALTALFGFALDGDLWGNDPTMLETVAARYGGVCWTAGYILRSQMSVQHFLDASRLRMDRADRQAAAEAQSRLLQAMLLSSLSNRRSIAQGEHDVASCISALSDCPLGQVTAHVILSALIGLLVWCEILPAEALPDYHVEVSKEEERKMQVASRLGRNLLIAQFHDVLAPMILSRTAFSGERTTLVGGHENDPANSALNWETHWRWTLLLFSWVSSIAGPEGLIAANSCGSLLLASGLAGSLRGALEDSEKEVLTTMFLPPPGMALMIGSALRNEWSYTDLLSDRLQIMIPLLPGMIVSLLSQKDTTTRSVVVLSEILTAVGGSFHRVYGGIIHSTEGVHSPLKRPSSGAAVAIKAAKTFVPHLLVITSVLERHIASYMDEDGETLDIIDVLRPHAVYGAKRRADSDSWVDVSTTSSESVVNELVVTLPKDQTQFDSQTLVAVLRSCQRSVLNTAAGLMSNAMALGGAGTTFTLWQSALLTLHESSVDAPTDRPHEDSEETEESSPSNLMNEKQQKSETRSISQGVLCRLVAFVLRKALKRESQWDMWSYEMSSAVSRTCALIEEKKLLVASPGTLTKTQYSTDQAVLLCVLLEILEYGRESTGWCQLALPSMPANKNIEAVGDMSEASKLMLPVLQPSYRIVLSSVRGLATNTIVRIPAENSSDTGEDAAEEAILAKVLAELDRTLTASIVGLSFASARDSALSAMAVLRKSAAEREKCGDVNGAQLCYGLICKVAEELRVRYESERRLRETALFDAYEDDAKQAVQQAVEGSQAIERLIFGGDGLGLVGPISNLGAEATTTEDTRPEEKQEETNAKRDGQVSEDFVLFHGGSTPDAKSTKLGFPEYEGLGIALENVKSIESDSITEQCTGVLAELSPFLDRWDSAIERDDSESELVNLFETVAVSDKEGEKTSPTSPLAGHISGSETAADAMSHFFELSAAEKTRLKEISTRFLPSHRYSRLSYTERFCWSEFMSFYSGEQSNTSWERTLSDGNRDIRSRIATFPAFPQFRPYIPGYLDHGPSSPPLESEEKAHHDRRQSTAPPEMDAFTKTLLEAGDLEIVDITKKETLEEDEPELIIPGKSDCLDDADNDPLTEIGPSDQTDSADETSSGRFSGADSSSQNIPNESDIEAKEASSREDKIPSEGVDDAPLEDEESSALNDFVGKGQHSIATSSFSTPPDNASSSLSLLHSAAAGLIEQHLDCCLHVKSEGNRQCTMLLTSTHLILEYEGTPEGFFEGEILAAEEEAERFRMIEEGGGLKDDGVDERYQKRASRRQREVAALRPKSIRYNLSEVSHIYLRRYRLRDSSVEIFFIPSGGTSFGSFGICSPTSSLFLDFGPGHEGITRRNDAAFALMRRTPPQAVKQWPDRSVQFLHEQLSRLTVGWAEGRVTNFDYLLHLNMLSGRTYNDICQYPVFPWVLSDYTSEDIPDLTDRKNFRDLSKPVGALNPERLEDFTERFNTFADPSIPPFMYGSHYSTSAGVVLHFLVRLHPFAGLHRQLQGGHFDVADRLFSSVPRTWSMCTGSSAAEVKEITPEWYCNPSFLRNPNRFKLGTSQDGEVLNDVVLPPWAGGSPEKFVEVMRAALESDVCSSMLPDWIDLIFGYKQQGPESIKANNVYFYLTYYGAVDVASIKDESLRQATELQIAHFGQCPMQLFKHRPHVRRLSRKIHRLPFYQLISAHCQKYRNDAPGVNDKDSSRDFSGEPLYLPFYSAPLSHWVHLDAPPPGPHSPLVAVRFAGTDRCLAVDGQGIFHTFRWTWRAEETTPGSPRNAPMIDKGCFVAQRELPRFRSVPRLMFSPQLHEQSGSVAVAISKTLFAGRSVLLVLSDADGQGAFGMQLVDPAKGSIRGEVTVPQIHSARITCIATDPIGTAAGHGGVGGELALVGSADGNASIWRFMSSHYLPLRPRLLLRGHKGTKLSAVAICAPIQIAATLSSHSCCLHSITNGTLIRMISPPENVLEVRGSQVTVTTKFADAPALAISVQGFVVCVCESTIFSGETERKVATLTLFTIEGVLLGSKPLEPWRGLPHKIQCIPDGTAITVCSGRGVTIHRISACHPLEIIDEWHITELDDLGSLESIPAAYDIEFGPSLNRPVIAAAACSNGALRLHALPGISSWSERHKKSGISQTVGIALAKPARRLKSAVKDGLGIGRQIAGMGRDIGREVTSDVKERGVGGFLNSMMFGKSNSK